MKHPSKKINLEKIRAAAQKAIDVTIPPKVEGPNDKCFCGHARKAHPIKEQPSVWNKSGIRCPQYWFNPHCNAHELQAMWDLLTPEVVIELINRLK
jgi:hypothetical protein